jgi:hypothetical protein
VLERMSSVLANKTLPVEFGHTNVTGTHVALTPTPLYFRNDVANDVATRKTRQGYNCVAGSAFLALTKSSREEVKASALALNLVHTIGDGHAAASLTHAVL